MGLRCRGTTEFATAGVRLPAWPGERSSPRPAMATMSARRSRAHRVVTQLMLGVLCAALPSTGTAQGAVGPAQGDAASGSAEERPPAVAQVHVTAVAHDAQIRARLQRVLEATGWFTEPHVEVREGVVFLSGSTETVELKKWAGELARSTQDVVAVANRVEVLEPSAWDFSPARRGLRELRLDVVRSLPAVLFGLLILALSGGLGVMVTRGARAFLRRRVRANLLRSVMARGLGVLVFLFGFYIVLRVSGLTQLALTVVGGTGLVGLALGIAFRDITENFLASIFLSAQRPFETGDLIEVAGVTGYVQQLNVRTTILMNLEGNLVQIPNASVYKTNLRNFTTNANRREDFVVGIGYDDAISEAQEIVLEVLMQHPAVLKDPEPWVLADGMGRATINLRVYFWLNGREHSWLKVRSSVIRLVKLAFQQHGISMPDEAREVIFPQGIPITMLEQPTGKTNGDRPVLQLPVRPVRATPDVASTKAEGGLSSEAGMIEEQARQVQPLNDGENLLKKAPSSTPPVDEGPSSADGRGTRRER